MAYPAIEDHGVIGNLRTVALVGLDGTIDWCCLPNFDSPSVFASLLDDEKGGWFRLSAGSCSKNSQRYLPDSTVLLTRCYADHGVGQIEDFMPVSGAGHCVHQLVRRVSCVRGEVEYELDCRPAFDYARASHRVELKEGGALFAPENGHLLGLCSPIPLERERAGVKARFHLKEGDRLSFTFFLIEEDGESDPFARVCDPEEEFEETLAYWQRWLARCTYRGRWQEIVYRSALTLKLLTYAPTGAIVAAPTMGLPEHVGGSRNWDYRYTWIRDAAFTLYALMRIGFVGEAMDFVNWLGDRLREIDLDSPTPLHLVYGIDGRHELEEASLDHLRGYRGSRPVYLGNNAYKQLQLDIYGELMDSIYLYNKYAVPVSYDLWKQCRQIVDWVAEHWDQPDEGFWEVRGGRKNSVSSRLMCWVALDRASRMCLKHSLPGDRNHWMAERDLIYEQIMTRGWDAERQSFRQHFDTHALDAANLLMPLVKFISPSDPRMIATIDRTLEILTTDSLVFRYDPKLSPDGLVGEEGTFCICTFWLVECLTRAGRLREARLIFEKMLGYANHVGLYAEQIGNQGEALGNFPQAFTHLGLISAAYNLDRALSAAGGKS